MAIPNPTPSPSNDWLLLGAITPNQNWQEFKTPFKNTSNTLRVSAFSQKDKYDRYCYLRVKYNVSNSPFYSGWVRVYPTKELRVITLDLVNELKSTPKSLQVIDYQFKKAIERSQNADIVIPVYQVNWVLTASILVS